MVITFFAGLSAGSVAAVVADRLVGDAHARMQWPPWTEHVPAAAWWRRRSGGTPATAYPGREIVVQVGTGALFVLVTGIVGVSWVLPAYWWFLTVTVALTLTDFDHKLIPNRILFPALAVAVPLLVVGSLADAEADRLLDAGLGAAVYFAFLFVVALAARGGFGFGDVKLALLLGLFLGYGRWAHVVIGAVGGFLIAAVLSVALLITGVKGRKDQIPFGPSMVAASYLAIALGDQIATAYLA